MVKLSAANLKRDAADSYVAVEAADHSFAESLSGLSRPKAFIDPRFGGFNGESFSLLLSDK